MTCKVHGNVNANDAHNYSAKKKAEKMGHPELTVDPECACDVGCTGPALEGKGNTPVGPGKERKGKYSGRPRKRRERKYTCWTWMLKEVIHLSPQTAGVMAAIATSQQ